MIRTPSHSQSDASIEIVAYDSAWGAEFDAERRRVEAAIGRWLTGTIEHVGSTAVPGMPAKPVVDMMAPVDTLEGSKPAIVELEGIGYRYFPYKADIMHWLCKPSPAHRTHHLHLVPCGSELWSERLAFRDALCRDAALAEEYARLKRELAAEYPNDREAYTEAKAPFVRRVLNELAKPR